MIKNQFSSQANGGNSHSFATSHQTRARGSPPTKAGRAEQKPGSSQVVVTDEASQYSNGHQAQVQSCNGDADLFGPSDQWCKASEVWSLGQWQALSAILFNGNTDPHEFLLCHPNANKTQQFQKAKRASLGWQIDEAHKTIAGTAKKPSGIGFYPYNAQTRESYWGGMDFDSHDGLSAERARSFAAKAVTFARAKSPLLEVIAATSGAGGGMHVLFFAREPRPLSQWSDYLRKVARAIGAPLEEGICELRPNETDVRPLGLRAPGSLNPKDGSFGLIAFDTLTPHLDEWKPALSAAKPKSLAKRDYLLYLSLPTQSSIKKQVAWSERQFLKSVCDRYAIKAPRTRRKRLLQMVGAIFNECEREVVFKAAAQQYEQARPRPQSSLKEHFADCARALADNENKYYPRKLSPADRATYKALDERDRAPFRVLRNWARGSPDYPLFYANCVTLAARLGVSGETASKCRTRFCEKGRMRKTAEFDRAKHRSACYQWLLDDPRDSRQSKNGAKP
jgi:hypothetical protein